MSARVLHLSSDLSLPLEAVTQAIGVVAKRRAGKSYLARKLAEQLLRARQQVVILDPKGDWWGIRSGADGKAAGYPVLVVGGERGDVPLEATGGELVARLVVEDGVSALIDLSLLRKHEVATFCTAFLETVYRLKAREQFRTPVMLVIDEADAIAPQKPQPNEARMLGAVEDIVRRGGQRGIGCALITQRTAVLNKNVLTQVQVLIALRTIAPQDLKAMGAWIDVHGTDEQRATLMASLPSLPVGDAWVWSPGWPTTDGIFARVHVAAIETFDSGRTPGPGEKPAAPKGVAQVDLEAVRLKMSATLERAKADDPKALRARIAQLEAELRKKPAATNGADVGILRAQLGDANRAHGELVRAVGKLVQALRLERENTHRDAGRIIDALDATITVKAPPPTVFVVPANAGVRPDTRPGKVEPVRFSRGLDLGTKSAPASGDLGKGERAVLTAAAQHPGGVTREQLTVLTGYKRSSRDTFLQRLKSAALLEEYGDRLVATTSAMLVLGSDFEPLPTGDALREHWLAKLPEGERRVFEVVVAAYPKAADRDAISEATGYRRSSRDTFLQRLRSRRLVETTREGVTASDELFGGET